MSWKRSLVYGAIITAVAVGYRVYSEYAGARFDEGLQKLETDMKKTLPRKVDEITTLEDVKYERSKNSYWYVVDTNVTVFDQHDLERTIQNQVCANADAARTIKEKGFSYEYHYVNKERAFLTTFTITKCP